MEIRSEWTLAADAASRLRRRYNARDYTGGAREWLDATLAALDQLGPTPSPEAVRAIWPHACWRPTCEECGGVVDVVVLLGPGREDGPFACCPACVVKALVLLDEKA